MSYPVELETGKTTINFDNIETLEFVNETNSLITMKSGKVIRVSLPYSALLRIWQARPGEIEELLKDISENQFRPRL